MQSSTQDPPSQGSQGGQITQSFQGGQFDQSGQSGQSDIGGDAQKLSSAAGNRIHSELDARKGTAAAQAKSVSTAIGSAADQLDDGAPQWLKSAFQKGAQQVQTFADTLEQKDSREILRSVQDLARSNPGAFLAGCAALGFVAARVLKAGATDTSSSSSTGQSRQPPVQRDEPMFRSSGTDTSFTPSQAGEFA